jgi:NDP-sugar pyrophosphorylase family protein
MAENRASGLKAVILAGGRGKRLGGLVAATNKCLLELGGKPVLEYNLERAARLPQVGEIIIIVGHRAEDIINKYGISYMGKRVSYVIQREQRGLVHAIECARERIGDDDFFLLLGDEVLINDKAEQMLDMFNKEGLFGVCGVVRQPDRAKISKSYSLLAEGDNRVLRLVEKPKKAFNEWQGTGHCILSNAIFSYIERTPTHPERGEKELPDLIQCAIDDGQSVKLFDLAEKYTNINSEDDLNEARAMVAGSPS